MSRPDSAFGSLPLRSWALMAAALLVFIVIATGKVRYTEGDSRYSLLVSQSILESGTVRLDNYQKEMDLGSLNNGHNWMVHHWDETDHWYYFYPLGSSILSLPVVWVARRLGMDMVFPDHEAWLQVMISAILLSLTMVQLVRMARLWLDDWAALAFGLLLTLGSSLASTGGTALWSHNWEALAIVTVLLELAEVVQGKREYPRGGRLGLLLFAAYLCRPTALVFAVLVAGYVGWKHREQLPTLLAGLLGPFAVFTLWSFIEFARPVPVYYDPSTWPSNEDFWGNLPAILLSPGRGLWVFMPFTLLAFKGFALRNLRLHPVWLLLWAWWLLHTLMVARSHMPWGGWCYGPRFYMEMVPGFALMLLMVSGHLAEGPGLLRRTFMPALGLLLLSGVYVHTVQGLHEPATVAWNDTPSIDTRWPESRWDWRDPQFLATAGSNNRRRREQEMLLPVGQLTTRLPKGSALLFGPPDAELRYFFAHWNKVDKLKGYRTYNSLHAAERNDEKELWVAADRLEEARSHKAWREDTTVHRKSLGEFLQADTANTVLLSVYDEGSYRLSPASRKYMRSLGSRIDSLMFRDSYAAIFSKGKLVWEDMGPRKIEYEWPGEIPVKLLSAGMDHGNWVKLEVGGKDYARRHRGFNAVVLSDNRTVIWSTTFDTHKEDAEERQLHRFVRVGGE